jgi:exopolyphosphatase/guanosine-5'-triphosphate,3'-diphosphate pyrophosphatase
MGCIATTRRFFSDGRISRKRWKEAQTEITAEFQQFAATYRDLGWQEAYGSSGTVKAIGDMAAALKITRGSVTDVALLGIRERLLEFEKVQDIRLPGLPADRRPVIAGGLLILDAAFAELGLKRMQVSDNALREGVLYDMLGRGGEHDPRDASIVALCERYGVDDEQAARVETTAMGLFEQVADGWRLDDDDRRLLAWAARIHEIGLVIAHSQHHQHGAYLVQYSDIAGFSRDEQQFIAALVRNQRRALHLPSIEALPDRLAGSALRCALLLRLSVLLHRSHDRAPIPLHQLRLKDDRLVLTVSKKWLAAHPLTRSDLDTEVDYLKDVGQSLEIRQE